MDYGPLGVELKENIKRQWWRFMVTTRDDVVGIDSSVILPRQVWKASGHIKEFVDPLVECQSCHRRYRADHIEEEYAERKGRTAPLAEIPCPNCGDRGRGPSRSCSTACSRPTSAPSRTSRACTTCGPRPRRASS